MLYIFGFLWAKASDTDLGGVGRWIREAEAGVPAKELKRLPLKDELKACRRWLRGVKQRVSMASPRRMRFRFRTLGAARPGLCFAAAAGKVAFRSSDVLFTGQRRSEKKKKN